MKHWLALTVIVALGLAAILVSERRKVDVPPGPAAILYLAADTEKELTRMPVHFTRIDDAEEVAIGDGLASAYELELKENTTPSAATVQKYLTLVGSRLVAHAHRKIPYKFHYIPEKSLVNAFAIPGGHVYVGEGLLALMDSEDELASVLGHEIEHIDHYHCMERAQLEQALRKVPFGELASFPLEIFQAGYSKDQELEADREGTRLAVAGGYSPNGAIRMFQTFQRMEESSKRKARNPEEEVGDVANQTLEGYFRSHPLPSERIAQIQRFISIDHWPLVAERDLAVGYIFWSARAEDLYKLHKYSEAQAVALRSLKMKPDQFDALDALAKAYFAQAGFVESAETYRRILQMYPARLDVAKYYAIALAAADKKTAAVEFGGWLKSASGDLSGPSAILPGLFLLEGNPAPAASLREVMYRESARTPPDQFGELGWMYYLAGDSPQALRLLKNAVQQRPGDMRWLTDRAWVQIESKNFEDALQSLNEVYAAGTPAPDERMARAVALWLSTQKDTSLRDFEIAVEEQPEWKNPKWVQALYSPLVAETVLQIAAEQERLRRLQEARMAHR
jgi:predicted Zn-dependent protease